MATNNQVNVGLSGSTGSGNFVGSTSPTLVTPTLGVANATSINFGVNALNYYATGSWSPSDASGASLTFTGVSANYTRIGNIVFAYAQLTYPSTASSASALIGSLPFACANANYATQGSLTSSTTSTLTSVAMRVNNNAMDLLTNADIAVTNVQLTGATIRFMMIYPIA